MESKAAAATPPYPSSARFADSQCYRLEEFGSDKSKCQEHFDVYKECKKKEREARLERNKSRSFFS
ncbi:cytochrome c oxidase-assembly factorX23 [Populus alba x Populus x berolinensis]|uniref:Cytochrome c oxidase-assembly factorX23 n=1 Tax=Populus alba x Populus x berolinensis TaxID=444605 RepID=A0AAD6REA2_9ROSI|nr:cytochrome c oxidase-assembly factorX23 [Populus alba x Populus x berolinensis]KAJ7007408.1 cytochrome c oxidase-assembly factorX23 [Populus alba x Populus x berolinensis]